MGKPSVPEELCGGSSLWARSDGVDCCQKDSMASVGMMKTRTKGWYLIAKDKVCISTVRVFRTQVVNRILCSIEPLY